MGRPKGISTPRRNWSKGEKLKAVNRVLINHETAEDVRKDLNINAGLLHAWIKKYLENGEKGLENKIKPGNPLSKYMHKKELTDMEKLEYENMKLRIENERLKKGYMVEGDGQIVIFNGSKNKNLK
jgi:transposase